MGSNNKKDSSMNDSDVERNCGEGGTDYVL